MIKKTLYIPLIAAMFASCGTANQPKSENVMQKLATEPFADGIPAQIVVVGGEEYKYPIMAIWVEDLNGNYLGTLYASKSISTGVFRYGVYEKGMWMPGERNRPAALPRWKNVSTLKSSESQPVDAFSGATPSGSFSLKTRLPKGVDSIRVVMEVNKPWDFNNYWHNNRYPGDNEYATSGQPALIYEAVIVKSSAEKQFYFKPIGHSHPSGSNGEIEPDISTFTSALKIVDRAWVEILK